MPTLYKAPVIFLWRTSSFTQTNISLAIFTVECPTPSSCSSQEIVSAGIQHSKTGEQSLWSSPPPPPPTPPGSGSFLSNYDLMRKCPPPPPLCRSSTSHNFLGSSEHNHSLDSTWFYFSTPINLFSYVNRTRFNLIEGFSFTYCEDVLFPFQVNRALQTPA